MRASCGGARASPQSPPRVDALTRASPARGASTPSPAPEDPRTPPPPPPARPGATMKVKAISRVEEDYTRERKSDALKVHRNLTPALRPMARRDGVQARAERDEAGQGVREAVRRRQMSGHSGRRAVPGEVAGVAQRRRARARRTARYGCGTCRRLTTLRRAEGTPRGGAEACAVERTAARCVSCGDDATVRVWRCPQAGLGEIRSARAALAAVRRRDLVCHSNRRRVQGRGLPLGEKRRTPPRAPRCELWHADGVEPTDTFRVGRRHGACRCVSTRWSRTSSRRAVGSIHRAVRRPHADAVTQARDAEQVHEAGVEPDGGV